MTTIIQTNFIQCVLLMISVLFKWHSFPGVLFIWPVASGKLD